MSTPEVRSTPWRAQQQMDSGRATQRRARLPRPSELYEISRLLGERWRAPPKDAREMYDAAREESEKIRQDQREEAQAAEMRQKQVAPR